MAPVFAYSETTARDYIFRGVSRTDNRPAIFGAARVTDNQFYVSAGIENVDFHNSTAADYDLSAGWGPLVLDYKFDFGVIYYAGRVTYRVIKNRSADH